MVKSLELPVYSDCWRNEPALITVAMFTVVIITAMKKFIHAFMFFCRHPVHRRSE